MAREESDREDLLREATALRERIEYALSDGGTVVVGFRSDGSGSIYFGADPVYQFNRRGALRRAFVRGQLVKAEAGRLVALERRRQQQEVQLVRHPADDEAAGVLLNEMRDHLVRFLERLDQQHYQVVGSVPSTSWPPQRVEDWLRCLLAQPISIAQAPGVREV
jgi:hypothetical protein